MNNLELDFKNCIQQINNTLTLIEHTQINDNQKEKLYQLLNELLTKLKSIRKNIQKHLKTKELI